MIHAAVAVVKPGDVLVVAAASASTHMFGELLGESCRVHGVVAWSSTPASATSRIA